MGASAPDVRDAYGRRPPPRGLVLAGLVAALLVGAAAGTVGGRLIAPAGPGATSGPAGAPPGGGATAAVPGVGPKRVVDGVPVGYAHDERGAATAAANYLSVLTGQFALDQSRLDAALGQVADPSTRSQLEADSARTIDEAERLWGIRTAAGQGKHVLFTDTPIAYKVTSYSPQQATVAVWANADVGVDGSQRLAAAFGIRTVTVVWLQGDWLLHSIDSGSSNADVVPACLQSPTPASGVPAQLDGFLPYGG